jgi:hypothetical protein
MVKAAWNFGQIGRLYDRHLTILESVPRFPGADLNTLGDWAREERQAWLEIMAVDPFLPEKLFPPGYLGPRVWSERSVTLREAGRWLV